MPDLSEYGPEAAQFLNAQFGIPAQSQAIQQLFQSLLASQGGQAMLGQANLSGQQATNALAASLGRSGLNQTGVGRTVAGLSAGVPASMRANILQQLFGQAVQGGQQNVLSRLQALPGFMNAQLQAQQANRPWWQQALQGLAGAVPLGFGQYLAGR